MNRVVYSLNSQVVEETANLPKLESLYKTLIPKQKARLKPKSTQKIINQTQSNVRACKVNTTTKVKILQNSQIKMLIVIIHPYGNKYK